MFFKTSLFNISLCNTQGYPNVDSEAQTRACVGGGTEKYILFVEKGGKKEYNMNK